MTATVAALFVEAGGVYYDAADVECWSAADDARCYSGLLPVVAHPPCARWCQLASVNLQRYGHAIGDDGGCFEAALAAVRRCGGVLEHPAYSVAWSRFGLPVPARGGWTQAFGDDGVSTEISQVAYGCEARKRTWLYAVGVEPRSLDWRDLAGTLVIGGPGLRSGGMAGRGRLETGHSSRTPIPLRDELLGLARSVGRAF